MANEDYRLQLIADLSQMERGLAVLTNQLAGVVGALDETDAALKRTGVDAESAAASTGKFTTSLNSTRYALYDISQTLLFMGGGLIALSVAPAVVAASFDRDFANVQRTVTGANDTLKKSLIDLSNTLPTSFKGITDIATLGGQLGIPKEGIVSFTKVVAELAATTNLSADTAATALGRFQAFGLVGKAGFEGIASAILKVGVDSVATESQITTIATGIAGIGHVAGLSAATLIGYAGALASVGVQTYAARGTTQRFIQDIQKAADQGGPALDLLAKISGDSADSIQKAFGTDKFNKIFQDLIKNLGDTSRTGQDLLTTLGQLGIGSVIDKRTLEQLAAAPDVVKQAFDDANRAINSGATLQLHFQYISETTSAKVQDLKNNFESLLNTIGSATSGGVNGFITWLGGLVMDLDALSGTGAGQVLLTIGSAIGLLGGVMAILASVGTRALASLLGVITALKGLQEESGAVGLLATIRTELDSLGASGKVAAFGISAVSVALKGMLVAAAVVGVAQLGGWLFSLGDNAKNAQINMDKLADSTHKLGGNYNNSGGAQELDKYIRNANPVNSSFNLGGAGALGQQSASGIMNNIASQVTGINGAFTTMGSPLKTIDDILGGLPGHFSGLDQAREAVDKIDKSLADLVKSGYADQAKLLFTHMMSMVDPGSFTELSGAFTQYNAALKQMQVASTAAATANDQLNRSAPVDLAKTLQQLSGLNAKDMTKYEDAYVKSVAPLTDFNNVVKQVNQTQKDTQAAQKAGISLQAYQDQQFKDSAVSLGDFTAQLEANNKKQAEWAQNLTILSTQAGPEAAQQFIQAGYSAVNASILQQLVNATPKQRDAYIAAQTEAADMASAQTADALLASGFIVTQAGGQIGLDTAKKLAKGIQLGLPVEALMQSLNVRFAGSPVVPQADTDPANAAVQQIFTNWNGKTIQIYANVSTTGANPVAAAQQQANQYAMGNVYGHAAGGYITGAGSDTSDSIPAMLSNGEYVIKASRVRALGIGFFDSLNQGRSTVPNHFAAGGPVSSASHFSSGIVELGPMSLSILRRAVQQEVAVYLGDGHIARSANRGNSNMNARGAN